MASITTSKTGHVRILFYDSDGRRQIVHLGKCDARIAQDIKGRIERLLYAAHFGQNAPPADAVWIVENPEFRAKFEAVGLIERSEPEPLPEPAKPVLTLAAFLDQYTERRREGVKPATLVAWSQVMGNLKQFIGGEIPLVDVTSGHAGEFVDCLKRKKMATTTIHKRVGFARQFFSDAVAWKIIDANPFAKIKAPKSKAKANTFVPRETIDDVLRHANPVWQLIIALSRYGGLRTPSETLSLKWTDFDWEKSRIHIPQPKLEHHEGRAIRVCPLFPELRPYIDAAWDAAGEDAVYVVDMPGYRNAAMRKTGWANANLRTHFLRILDRAKVAPWPRLFHSMRASRQTELVRNFPKHVVCSWIGNTEEVADEHYLLVTEDDFARAIEPPARETKSAKA